MPSLQSDNSELLDRRPGALAAVRKLSYTLRWLPAYAWQRLARRLPRDPVHLIIALADHFEPSIVPSNGQARAPYGEQERRLERWCREYPRAVSSWRDNDGFPFAHTYFYPAEQYDRALLDCLAEHCRLGWGEIEIHLHHGVLQPDTAENTRRQLLEFRDALASKHGSLCYFDGKNSPRFAFVHGNFALANSFAGRFCGVDNEIEILAETGCYADMTLPPGPFDPSQVGKINSLYECDLPLGKRAAHRHGRDLQRGRPAAIFPLMVEGPMMLNFSGSASGKLIGIENGALTGSNPPSIQRLKLWKQAAISVQGRPDWLFIKLHCHSMDPTQEVAVLGEPAGQFLRELVQGAQERREVLHFVSAREMTNMILAACDGHEGNPGQFRDYRLKRERPKASLPVPSETSQATLKG